MTKYEIIKEYLGEGKLNKWVNEGTWNQVVQAMDAYHLEQKRLEKIESSSRIIDRLNHEIKERDRIILQDLDAARKGIRGNSQKANEENMILIKARMILQSR